MPGGGIFWGALVCFNLDYRLAVMLCLKPFVAHGSVAPRVKRPFALSSPRSGRVEGFDIVQQRFLGSWIPFGKLRADFF